ncbi:hypothetical protein [Bradyrhizobium sp. HKCCYLR20261]|uniref:hypothetical protein n=1 Tax=Bradyrhizobium sp. HKCCYLR20261 TaxID=3420760 RepID=UPI003EB9C3F2
MLAAFVLAVVIAAVAVLRRWPDHLCVKGESHVTCFRSWLSAVSPIIALIVAIGIALPQMEAARHSAESAERSANAADQSASTTAKSLELSATGQRAWLNPARIVLEEPPALDQIVKAGVVFTNNGREPAFDIGQRHELRVIEGYLVSAGSINFDIPPPNCDGVVPVTSGIVVYPSMSGLIDQYQHPIDPTLLADPSQKANYSKHVMESTAILVATGCMAYRTGLRARRSAYCYWLDLSPLIGEQRARNHSDAVGSILEQQRPPRADLGRVNQQKWIWRACEKGHQAT